MKEEDKILVEQARAGSEIAFSTLYNKYKKTVWYTAIRVVRNPDTADDITSQTFIKVYNKLKSFEHHISFEMWLKTIALNTAIDYLRRSKNDRLSNSIDDEDNTLQLRNETEDSPEENYIHKQSIDVIMQCIPKLKKQYRDLIYAKLDNKTVQEMAEQFALPEATIKMRLTKARRRLKKLINNY